MGYRQRMRFRASRVAIVVAAAVALAGCANGDDSRSNPPGPITATIYSSFPLRGEHQARGRDLVRAIRLALEDARQRAGGVRLRYVSLDATAGSTGRTEPIVAARNARRAVQDATTVAYIGELESADSAVSIPITNEAGVLQVSPTNTVTGLTTSGPGALPGEPARHYVRDPRTYARVIATNRRQAAAQVELMEELEVRSVYVLDDGTPYGTDVAANLVAAAERAGLTVAGRRRWDPAARSFTGVADGIRASRPDAIFTGGTLANAPARLYEAIGERMPAALIFAPDALAVPELSARLGAGLRDRVLLTSPIPGLADPEGEARGLLRRLAAAHGTTPGAVDPYAPYAYEAARAVIAAVAEAGADPAGVVEAFFSIEDRDSVLGRYDIAESGDTSLDLFAAAEFRGSELVPATTSAEARRQMERRARDRP